METPIYPIIVQHDTRSDLHPPKSAVLLIFMPTASPEWTTLIKLADALKDHFGDTLHILKIDQDTHPEMIHTFDIAQLPTFVLIRQGSELWRHEGELEEPTLITICQNLLQR